MVDGNPASKVIIIRNTDRFAYVDNNNILKVFHGLISWRGQKPKFNYLG